MRKHDTKNDAGDFTLNLPNEPKSWRRDQIQIALLADIRRELRKLNATAARTDTRLAKSMKLSGRRSRA